MPMLYQPPLRDMQFLLHEVLNVSQQDIPGYDEIDADTTQAILDEAGRVARDVLAPLNEVGDRQGCTLEDGVVTVPDGFPDAYRLMREGGWIGLDCDPDYGGQGMPYLIGTAVGEMFVSANMAFNMYQGLAHGAIAAIHAHGSDEIKQTYLPNMVEGIWTGTMNLTEPQCGTDLGLIRTKAEPQDDGTYKISGTKIWISAGEHEMADNIIHLVLARIPGGPDGIKGISLFVVPKFHVGDDGTVGERNGVSCGGLEHKMGINGNATCVMNYENATGYLIGEMHKGMRAMFTMMNEARVGVGLQGYAQAETAYQNALEFAKERLQGRAITGPANPEGPADPIIVHPDVRRNLMHQKSFVEGARAFAYWGATLIDEASRKGDADAEALVSLLTPVIKGFLTDKGFETTVLAQQTLGGSGYTKDFPLEQIVRDTRISMVYEGTNGVQSLDLVGRKIGLNNGQTLMRFFEIVKAEIKAHEGDEDLKASYLAPLKAASEDLQTAAMFFMEQGLKNPNAALAGSYDFMHLFGHVALGLMWTRMAAAAKAGLESGGDKDFYETKLTTGRYYMARQLPITATHLARIHSGPDTVMALSAEQF